jgi:hypothetical protein
MTSRLECTIPKEKIWDDNYLKFVLQVSASSASFGSVALTQPAQETGVFTLRGNLNAMLVAPFGSGKTTQIFRICGTPIVYANKFTYAGLTGSVNKMGQPTIGAAFKAGGKLLMMDETQGMALDVKDAMNSILEAPHRFSRDIGFSILKNITKGSVKSGAHLAITANQIRLYSKFSCIASSMYIKLGNSTENAWYSRFVPIRLNIDSFDYYRRLSAGEIVMNIDAVYYKDKIDFSFPQYMEFHKWFWDRIDNSNWKGLEKTRQSDLAFVNRSMGDIDRMAAFIAMTKGGTEIQVEDAKYIVEKYHDQMLYNLYMGPLTENEYKILAMVNVKAKQDEMAMEVGISQPTVSRILLKLKRMHLISGDVPIIEEPKTMAAPEDGEDWDKMISPKEMF